MPNYTDPFRALGTAAGAGGGGLLGQVSDLLSAPRKGLWSLFGGPEHGGDLPGVRDVENPLLRGILGMGAEIAGDPLTLAGGVLGRLAGRGLGAAADALAARPGVRNLLPLRRNFTVLKDVHKFDEANPWESLLKETSGYATGRGGVAGRPVGGVPRPNPANPTPEDALREMVNEARWQEEATHRAALGLDPPPKLNVTERRLARLQEELGDAGYTASRNRDIGGYYSPRSGAAVQYRDSGLDPRLVVRHESGHGLFDQAALHGKLDDLPPLWGAARRAKDSESPLLQSLGRLGEEALVRAASVRDPWRGAREAWDFLDNPSGLYANVPSPLVAEMYRQRMFTGLPGAVGVAGAALPTAAGLYYLLDALQR